LPFPDSPQTYKDVCVKAGTDGSQYDPFPSPPATYESGYTGGCSRNPKSNLVYESELQVLPDPALAAGRGKVVKHYPLPSYPAFAPGNNQFEHHGFIFLNFSCPGGNCWFGGLYYFPKPVPSNATHDLNIMGAQGTASGGYLVTLTRAGKLRLYGDSSQNGIPIVFGRWISIRVQAPSADNSVRTLIVTDLEGNPLVPGQPTVSTKTYPGGLANVNRVKFGCGDELDEYDPLVYRQADFWWYQDNMYVADQTADPGVWQE